MSERATLRHLSAQSNHLDCLPDIANDSSILPNCQKVYWIGNPWDHACTEALAIGGLELVDFRGLNPSINEDCTNLQINVSYCIQGKVIITAFSDIKLIPPRIE